MADVVAARIAGKTKIQAIERGERAVKLADARTLCWFYGANEATTESLVELALNTETAGWWEDYADLTPPRFGTFVELEAAASQVRAYDAEVVYGLLQTQAYHRAIAEADPRFSPEDVERLVEFRSQRRRATLGRTPPLNLTVILGEGALTRQIGGKAILDAQRDHLLTISREPNVRILIIPWEAGAHVEMRGPYTLMSFDSEDDPDVVHLDTLTGGRYEDRPEKARMYRDSFNLVASRCQTIEEYLK